MLELNKIYNQDCLPNDGVGGGIFSIPDKSVPLVLTDIPYGECNGRCDGIRNINKGGADEVNFDIDLLVKQLMRVSNGSIYIFCGIEQVSTIRATMRTAGMTTRLCIYEKTNPSPLAGEYMWLSAIECCVFGRWPKATFNEFCKSPVWRFPSGSSKIHPTQKPIGLFRYIVRTSSNPGDLVLDPFIGSGTTAEACVLENRNFIGFELNKEYYEKANDRINSSISTAMFGIQSSRVNDGDNFDGCLF